MTARLITIDGPGGVGKSTLATALARQLGTLGHPVHATAEPSTGGVGVFTRANADHISGHSLACLVAADRYHHLDHEIQPALADGRTVICDRYLASSLVLQRIDGVPVEFILTINAAIRLPDLAIILTAEPHTIAQRLANRGTHDRFEQDPRGPEHEVALYADAYQTLRNLRVRTMLVQTEQVTPTEAAASIIDHLANLGSHG
jgi:dTMP kinase